MMAKVRTHSPAGERQFSHRPASAISLRSDNADQAAYAPNREQLIKRRISDSELARLRVGEPERVAYGQAEIELGEVRERRPARNQHTRWVMCEVAHTSNRIGKAIRGTAPRRLGSIGDTEGGHAQI